MVSVGCLEQSATEPSSFFRVVSDARPTMVTHWCTQGGGVTQRSIGRGVSSTPTCFHWSTCRRSRRWAAVDGFVVDDVHNIGTDYDPTLMAWRERFDQAWPRLEPRYGRFAPAARFESYLAEFYLLMTAGFFRARQAHISTQSVTPPRRRLTRRAAKCEKRCVAPKGLSVLVDEDNRVLGTMPKVDICTARRRRCIRGFSCFVFRARDGHLLLHGGRAKIGTWPLTWSNSCCGHPERENLTSESASAGDSNTSSVLNRPSLVEAAPYRF